MNVRQEATDHYRRALATGENLSGADLGRMFDRSPSWGRSVAAEIRAETNGHDVEVRSAYDLEVVELTREGHLPGEDLTHVGNPEVVEEPAVDEVPAWVARLTMVAVLAVATAAGVASVDHLAALAELAGTEGWRRWLLPAAVDGLAVAAALTLYGAHRGRLAVGWLPWVALLAGLLASVLGNVASVYPELAPESWLRIGVGATPPLSLALAVELALRQLRH